MTTHTQSFFDKPSPTPVDIHRFEHDLLAALGMANGGVTEELLSQFLQRYFSPEAAAALRVTLERDLAFFRDWDPASKHYSDLQILSVRRGMAAIAAHRIFGVVLRHHPDMLYDIEVISKGVQKNTNVEIHPFAQIGVPFGIDHGHGTVIGATSMLGEEVFIYHGVTLGATGRRSKSDRRHPKVGKRVFFGNGSQVLGPSVLEDDVMLSSGVLIADSYLHAGVRISLDVRVMHVVVPANTRIYAHGPEDPRRYWAQGADDPEPRWIQFDRCDVGCLE
jgi:serine O-acetyltransferase